MLKSLDRKVYGEYSDLQKGMWAENMEDEQEGMSQINQSQTATLRIWGFNQSAVGTAFSTLCSMISTPTIL